jgi:putative DNA primase/helicase
VRTLTVSFGTVNLAAVTAVRRLEWPAFAEWLTEEPPEVDNKAVRGWYCPVEFEPAYRDSQNFVARHALTFDFDHVVIDTWGDVINAWESTAFAMYTTFSHLPEAPRFRVVMPLSRPAGYDEFQAVARKVAADVGIELVARESFVPAQMMFAPTRRLGGVWTSRINEGDWLDVDGILDEYGGDWTDPNQWPHRRDADNSHLGSGDRVHPGDKPGIIGEFNRAFTISEAIEKFGLPYRRVR